MHQTTEHPIKKSRRQKVEEPNEIQAFSSFMQMRFFTPRPWTSLSFLPRLAVETIKFGCGQFRPAGTDAVLHVKHLCLSRLDIGRSLEFRFFSQPPQPVTLHVSTLRNNHKKKEKKNQHNPESNLHLLCKMINHEAKCLDKCWRNELINTSVYMYI